MSMTLVATFDIRENYGAHDWDGKGECPSYWKCKGRTEEVLTILDFTQVTELGYDGIRKLARELAVKHEQNDEYYEITFCDYTLVHVDSDLIEKVREVAPDHSWDEHYGYIGVAIDLGITEYAAKEAMKLLEAA